MAFFIAFRPTATAPGVRNVTVEKVAFTAREQAEAAIQGRRPGYLIVEARDAFAAGLVAAGLPPEFNRRGATCGAIVFWTR